MLNIACDHPKDIANPNCKPVTKMQIYIYINMILITVSLYYFVAKTHLEHNNNPVFHLLAYHLMIPVTVRLNLTKKADRWPTRNVFLI